MLEIKINGDKIYAPLRNRYLALTPEEIVRQEYICRLVNDYGYSLEQMDQEIRVNNSQRGTGMARADIVIWKSKEDKLDPSNPSPIIVIECKSELITIREEDYFQGFNYASWAGADFFVTTNLKETRIFRVVKGKMPKQLIEIVDFPKAVDVQNNKKIKELLEQTKVFTREEFSKLLFKCHSIIRNNDKLSPEAAFDEISKILFIKIRFEKKNTGTQIFSKDEFLKLKKAFEAVQSKDSRPFYQQLFENTKEDYSKDKLFEKNDTLKIKEASFEAIVEELQIYNLSRTADDVKGIAFERFLGKTFRGELGQFFTPRTIVDFMVEILDPSEGEVVCDPCCGSGGFLIKAFEYVRDKIENDIQNIKEEIKKQMFDIRYEEANKIQKKEIENYVNSFFTLLNAELDTSIKNSRLQHLSSDCIFGTDANPRMARTAKMNMIMHGDGHGGVHHHDGLLNVNGIFENRFDVILTNPPFGARVEKSLVITEADKFTDVEMIKYYKAKYGEEAYTNALAQINDHVGEPVLNLFDSGKLSALTEVLFIERCIRLLKPGGRLGIVLPEGVLNNQNLQMVRELFEGRAKIILITSIPQDVFMASGAMIKPSIMFFKKFTNEEEKQYKEIVKTVKREITSKYSDTIAELNAIIENKEYTRSERASKRRELRSIEIKIEEEAKPLIKERFDYLIPIAQIDKAGITTTGSECENELTDLVREFVPYREKNILWKVTSPKYQYKVKDKKLLRLSANENWIELC
ncbi:N-6 DNA methylase [Bacteroides fragilis]|uniref:N-6 DNA methylase n=1 Tax=Bacteroides fragilis TaxID=817 RepID=UPI00202DFC23|nr:N-6 DNA methylase [Bacteroides fragilis]MCM0204818.1 N-6 DNA methylase [Bacteroides fragilis]